MDPINLTPELLVSVLAMGISLLFKYVPKLRTKYAALCTEVKSYIMLGMLIVLIAGIWALSYWQVIATTQPVSIWTAFSLFYYAISSNQFMYLITPEPEDVTQAKALRGCNGDAG